MEGEGDDDGEEDDDVDDEEEGGAGAVATQTGELLLWTNVLYLLCVKGVNFI